jgi:4-diphosphocytidyl-2C-methyl-D-erythritol kinase
LAARYADTEVSRWEFGNDFDEVVCERRPRLDSLLCDLRCAGAVQARLSGSGAVGIGVFASCEEAERAAMHLSSRWPKAWMLRPLDLPPPVALLS